MVEAHSVIGAKLKSKSVSPLRFVALAVLVVAAVLPLFGTTFYIRLAIEALLVATLALSIDILLGFAGLLSLGQAAFFGLAAYISALMLMNWTENVWLVLVVVVGVTSLLSALLGAVAVRTRGVYFALITFGFGEILFKITMHTSAIGGSDGLLGIPTPAVNFGLFSVPLSDNIGFFYLTLGLVLILYLLIKRLLDTPFGLVLRAIHDNESRIPYLGYNPFWFKLSAFILAANVAAIGGMIYPILRGYVGPNLFAFEMSLKAVVMALVGGIGTLIGAFLGGGVITFLESVVSTYFKHHSLIIGALFVACVLFFPSGLAGALGNSVRRPSRGADD